MTKKNTSTSNKGVNALEKRLQKPVVALDANDIQPSKSDAKNPFILGTASINSGLVLIAKKDANVKSNDQNKKQQAFDTNLSEDEKKHVIDKAAEHQEKVKEMFLDLISLRIGFRAATADILDGVKHFLGESLSDVEVDDFLREARQTHMTRIMEKALYTVETKRIAELAGLDGNFIRWMTKSRINGTTSGTGDGGSNFGDGGIFTVATNDQIPPSKAKQRQQL